MTSKVAGSSPVGVCILFSFQGSPNPSQITLLGRYQVLKSCMTERRRRERGGLGDMSPLKKSYYRERVLYCKDVSISLNNKNKGTSDLSLQLSLRKWQCL